MEPKYVLVTGSRDWTDIDIIKKELEKLEKNVILIHGGAKGADSIAGRLWKQMGGKVIECKADWDKYGKAAGPKRNEQMLTEFDISSALAFRNGCSKGTSHMVELLKTSNIPYVERWMNSTLNLPTTIKQQRTILEIFKEFEK